MLIHGYSDKGASFRPWKEYLQSQGLEVTSIDVANYVTLSNEVTIKDLAEGFDRALKIKYKELPPDFEFDAIVHSTGMLVLRSWLCTYNNDEKNDKRRKRLKHLIGLAPASFGSPLAYKGRSWLGALVKGSKELGPDFMEAGDKVLDGLELASSYTWDLAHRDLLNENKIIYGSGDDTPYVFILIGNKDYGLIKNLVAKAPGSDGTVRHAGCSLNTRKITMDFTQRQGTKDRFKITEWSKDQRTNLYPIIPVEGLNHGTILEKPNDLIKELVTTALKVDTVDKLKAWYNDATAKTDETLKGMKAYQQFVVHCVDERGDGIPDFHIELYYREKGKEEQLANMEMHAYSGDSSYRCYHINLSEQPYFKKEDITNDTETLEYENVAIPYDTNNLEQIRLELIASSGTDLIGYADNYEEIPDYQAFKTTTIVLDMTEFITANNKTQKIFLPFTTTLIEIILNREPLPINSDVTIFEFLPE